MNNRDRCGVFTRAVFTAARALAISASLSLLAQDAGEQTKDKAKPMDHSHMDHSQMKGDANQDMSGMKDMPGMDSGKAMNEAGTFLMGESSGTAFQPSAWPMPMLMNHVGDWSLMWMGQAFLVDTQQAGSPRAGDKFYSTNWGMLSAQHQVGKGSVMLRGMMSLEPATVTNREYPLLFQTGETAFGKPIVDGQHPHDLFMELSIQYAHPLSEKGTWNAYYAPVGEPALGPIAYPHRASAMELPQAALSHHWQDSSHIANNVFTAGISYAKVRIEASGFYGREPDENRWNIDFGRMDSWSTRFSVFPTKNWSGQISVGRLRNPEQAHPGDVVRTTASVHYIRPAANENWWAGSLVWGQDHKVAENRTVNAVLGEAVVPIRRKNFITGRYEWSQRDELFENDHALADLLESRTGQAAFKVNAFTLGYTRDIPVFRNVQSGLGFNITTYAIDEVLKPYYGAHAWGVNLFARFRLKAAH
ncbi:MAG: hypothetical protein ACJ746_28540 [Bryobacteraceae bacterium]